MFSLEEPCSSTLKQMYYQSNQNKNQVEIIQVWSV